MTVGETYQVTVQTDEAVPVGTTLEVTVTANNMTGDPASVLLTADNPSENVSFTAPDVMGDVVVMAIAEVQAAVGALEVMMPDAATLAVTVSAQDVQEVQLTLSTPGVTVEAGSTFSVTVETDIPVPEGAEVRLMVTFEERTEPVTLPAGATTASVMFTAPGTTGIFAVEATGTGTPSLTVTPTSESVTVGPVAFTLVLMAPGVVDGDSIFTAVVNTEAVNPGRVLPDFAEVKVMVQQLDSASSPTMLVLSATMPTANVEFTAPPSGLLELTAEVTNINQDDADTVVAVSDAVPVQVQVTELRDIMLTVSATPSVTVVGSTITVTVGVADAALLPAGTEVTATVSFQAAERRRDRDAGGDADPAAILGHANVPRAGHLGHRYGDGSEQLHGRYG